MCCEQKVGHHSSLGMTILFGSTSMEAVVITFERRVGSFERLLLAPVSLAGVLMGKIIGGAFFGFIVSSAVLIASLFAFSFPNFDLIRLIPSLILSSMASQRWVASYLLA